MNQIELTFKTAQLAGQILMESNCEAYRVEETLLHIFSTIETDDCSVIALGTGLYMSVTPVNHPVMSAVKRITTRNNNLMKISLINEHSFALAKNEITIEELYEKLIAMPETPYSLWVQSSAVFGFILFFILLREGTFQQFLYGLVLAFCFSLAKLGLAKTKLNLLLSNALLSFLVALLIIPASRLQIPEDTLIVASIMPLVPGTALTNGFRDIFKGDYMSGLAKLMEALLIALFIAWGIGLGLWLGKELQ